MSTDPVTNDVSLQRGDVAEAHPGESGGRAAGRSRESRDDGRIGGDGDDSRWCRRNRQAMQTRESRGGRVKASKVD